MKQGITSQHFSEIMHYPLQDSKWFSRLCLQGAALIGLCYIFIGIPFLVGFMIRCIQKGIDQESTLPDWSEWGLYWKLGWKGLVVTFVYAIPLMFVWSIIGTIIIGLLFVINSSNNADILGLIIFLAALFGYFISMLYVLVLWIFQPAYYTAIAVGRPIRECISVTMMWKYIKANFITIIVMLAIGYLASMLGSLGMLVFFVGLFFTIGYGIAVMGYATGVVYRLSALKFE